MRASEFDKKYVVSSAYWGVGAKTKTFSVISKKTDKLKYSGGVTSLGSGWYEVYFDFPRFRKTRIWMGVGFRLTPNSIKDVVRLAIGKVFNK